MQLSILITLQAATATLGPATTFDLATVKAPAGCDASGSDIVVCGRSATERSRLKDPMPQGIEAPPALPKAEIGVIGKLRATTETESAGVGGFPSNRVMLRLKMPF